MAFQNMFDILASWTKDLFDLSIQSKGMECLDSWVVSHLALNISMPCHTLGKSLHLGDNKLFLDSSTTSTLFHDSIWLIWFETFISLSNLSCELWKRKLKINKNYLNKNIKRKQGQTVILTTFILMPSERETDHRAVWPVKSRQMSIKVAQKWFH